MIDDLEPIRRARPRVTPPGEHARARARGALEEAIARRPRRRGDRGHRFALGPGAVALALSVVVVAGVVGVFLGLRGHQVTVGSGRGSLQLVFRAARTPGAAEVTPSEVQRTAALIRRRLASVAPAAQVSVDHDDLIIRIPRSPSVSVAGIRGLVERSDELFFFDWEANVLTPSGKPAADLLRSDSPSAIAISQGTSNGPGAPGAGSLSLYAAVKLAARQAPYTSSGNSREGPEYFMFGKSRSRACDAAGSGAELVTGVPCYLAGPAGTRSQLSDQLPNGIAPAGARILKVDQGWNIVEAAYPAYHWPPIGDPSAQFFVMRDRVAVGGGDITDPHASTDQAGQPDVAFGFTPKGATEFQNVTKQIAQRGALVSGLGQKLFQHFAVVLGSRLVTVPYIDYEQNPFGIPGNSGAVVVGDFTKQSARRLAASITPLPLRLTLVSANRQPGN